MANCVFAYLSTIKTKPWTGNDFNIFYKLEEILNKQASSGWYNTFPERSNLEVKMMLNHVIPSCDFSLKKGTFDKQLKLNETDMYPIELQLLSISWFY